MTETDAPVLIVTREHFLKCTVPTRGRRLLDLLQEQDSQFLSVHDAQVRCRQGAAENATCSQAVIRKATISLIIPAQQTLEVTQKRIDTFISKKQHAVFLTVHGYQIRGSMKVNGAPDPLRILCLEAGEFIPIINASVSSAGLAWDDQPPRLVFVNREHVALLQILEPSRTEMDDPVASSHES